MSSRSKAASSSDRAAPWLILCLLLTAGTAAVGWLWYRLRWLPWEEQRVEIEPLVPQAAIHPVPEEQTPDGAGREIQLPSSGAGLVFHRRYRVDTANAQCDPEAMIRDIKQNLSPYFPPFFVRLEKTLGKNGSFDMGDEYYLHMIGPWDAPIRAIADTRTSLTFFTLEGHMEAGEIRFRFVDHPRRADLMRLEIVSWARSRDELLNFVYANLQALRWPQTLLWISFCSRVVEKSGGDVAGKVRVLTQKAPFRRSALAEENEPAWEVYRRRIERLQHKGINFDLEKRDSYTKESGWNIDNYCAPLPGEPPGEPIQGGPWEIARDIIRNYEFPNPRLITGIFPPDELLEDRDILLKAHFLGSTFYFGARVGEVIDEIRHTEDGGEVRVWGFSCRTLEGHIEQGEMTFTVRKYLETGAVEFHIDAYSRGANAGNPFYRLGWRLFGRRLQKRYAREAQERMQQMVVRRLQGKPPITEVPEVRPSERDAEAAARIGGVAARNQNFPDR